MHESGPGLGAGAAGVVRSVVRAVAVLALIGCAPTDSAMDAAPPPRDAPINDADAGSAAANAIEARVQAFCIRFDRVCAEDSDCNTPGFDVALAILACPMELEAAVSCAEAQSDAELCERVTSCTLMGAALGACLAAHGDAGVVDASLDAR